MTQNAENPITTELSKQNVTDAVIKKLKTDFLPLKINGIDDKAGYKLVHDARIQCRDLRVLAEKICKKGREDANRISKEWIAKEKEVVAQIQEVELHLKKQEDAVDAEIEAKKIRAERLLKLPGRKEQIVGIENYFAMKLSDEIIMGFGDPEWNNLVLIARSKKLEEQEAEQKRKQKIIDDQILATRTNELISVGCWRGYDGSWLKGNHGITEQEIISLPDQAWTPIVNNFRSITIPESKPENKPEVKKTEPVYYSPQISKMSDEEILWNYASGLEKVQCGKLSTDKSKEVLRKAQEKMSEVLTLLRS